MNAFFSQFEGKFFTDINLNLVGDTSVTPYVELTGKGDFTGKLSARDISDNPAIADLPYTVGEPFDFLHDEAFNFESGKLTFTISDTLLAENNINDLVIAHYNYENGNVVFLDTEIINDTTICAPVEHFSTYFVVNKKLFSDILGYEEWGFFNSNSETIRKYSGHTYAIIDEYYPNWNDAKAYAEKIGGHLVTITTAAEQYAVESLMYSVGTKKTYWLGGENFDGKTIKWVTGEKSQYSNWGDGEPNSHTEKYIHMVNDINAPYTLIGQWNDTLNDFIMEDVWYSGSNCGIIVEWDTVNIYPVRLSNNTTVLLVADPLKGDTTIDTDGDGLPDLDELTEYRYIWVGNTNLKCWTFSSSPASEDTDDDGLLDTEENAIGTSPSNKYSDSDTVEDGEEYFVGMNPLDRDTDGDGLDDGLELQEWFDPLEGNIDGDTYNDKEEYEKGTSPFVYTMNSSEAAKAFAEGAALGDWGSAESIEQLSGQIAGAFVPFADARDYFANVFKNFDTGAALLNLAGLAAEIIPIAGVGSDVAKALPRLGKFVDNFVTDTPKVIAAIVEAEKIFPNSKDVVPGLVKLLPPSFADELADSIRNGDKLTKAEYDKAVEVLQECGKTVDEIPMCFVAGTPISTENDFVLIENIKIGNKVWSFDENTSQISLKTVTNVFENETLELIHVTANDETISTTPNHPFYVPVKGWVDAVNLRAGDVLFTLNGEYVIVEQVQHEILENPVKVYNFEVADNHTYFVGENAFGVHNNGCGKSPKRMTTTQATEAAKKLGYTKIKETSHGQPVYKKGRKYITPDVDQHNGGVWKMADSVENLGSKSTRMGTYDENLNRIGD